MVLVWGFNKLIVCHVAHHTSLLTQTNINSTDVALIQLFGRKISLGLVSYTVDATKARSLQKSGVHSCSTRVHKFKLTLSVTLPSKSLE